jgi:hypothetical protein
MASTASTVAVAMEIIAALGMSLRATCRFNLIMLRGFTDLFYDIRLNAAVAMFQIFASQMIGYGIAGLCACLFR